MDKRDLKQSKRFILIGLRKQEITEKYQKSLIYLLNGVLVRLKLLNSEFDCKELRKSLQEWYSSLEKSMLKFS